MLDLLKDDKEFYKQVTKMNPFWKPKSECVKGCETITDQITV